MLPLILLFVVAGGLIGLALWLRRHPLPGATASTIRTQPLGVPRPVPWYAARGRRGYVLLALIALLAGFLLLNSLGLLAARPAVPPDEFVVRIAPFISNGEDQRQGAIVADQLLQALTTRVTTPMNIGVLQQPIQTAADAARIAEQNNIDALIWGQVSAGTTAEQAGLRPYLHWRPSAPFVPRTWQGYDGHWVLPYDYDLAVRDLNGPAVLAPLLDGLNYFVRGDADRAADVLEKLQRDYSDVLRAELPAMLRGLVLWAEGRESEAESQFRAAVESVSRPEHWNNYGAILLDQQKFDAAREALTEALKAAPNLGQAHANLGRLLLDEGRPAEALPDLRSAAAALPNSPAVIAALGEALRRSGQLDQARAAVTTVLQLDDDNGPALAEQSMLALTPVTTTQRLEWELEGSPTRTLEDMNAIRQRTAMGIAQIEALRNDYLRQAAAYGADIRPDMQRLAETQAAILEQELLNRRYQLMLVQIEQGRVVARQSRSGVRRFWDTLRGVRTPIQEAIATADDALKQQPNLPLQYDYLYQQGRAAYLSNNPNRARQAWEDAIKLTETAPATSTLQARPEAQYGLAQLFLDDNQRDQAVERLSAALAADERFFPAHQRLATLADEDKRWADAINEYRWLAQNRPLVDQYRRDLARVLRANGETAAAEAQLLPLANADDVAALVQLASLYRSVDRLEQADQVLQRALRVAPADAAVHEELAAVARARNDDRTAEAELQRALELDPTRISARIALGQLYAGRLNRPADAAAQFRAVVDNAGADPLVHRQLGEVLLQIGQPAAALESFQQAVKLDPQSHEAQHGLASAYLALGRLDEALEAEQKSLALANGNYTLAIVGLGDIARQKRDYNEAVTQYRAALDRDPQLAIAYLGLGRVALDQGQTDIALTHFNNGLAIDPQNVRLLLGQGDALLQQNDLSGAQAAYSKVRDIDSNNAAAHAGIGRTLWKSGQTDAALTELAQAAQLDPSDAETLLNVGDINASLERREAALDAYTRAIEARPDWHEPRFRRGVLLLTMQQNERAIADLEEAVQRNPDFAQGHYWLGRAYRATSRFGDAQRQFRRAIEIQGDYYEARYFLGRTLDELGNAPDAIATYEAIIAEAPTNDQWRSEAQRELDRIR